MMTSTWSKVLLPDASSPFFHPPSTISYPLHKKSLNSRTHRCGTIGYFVAYFVHPHTVGLIDWLLLGSCGILFPHVRF